MKINFKRYSLYLVRWQMSTPILSLVMILLVSVNQLIAVIIANLIGGLIFYWVDRFIFISNTLDAQWEIKENIECSDCSLEARGYRLVKTINYDMSRDPRPKFRCESCSQKKTIILKKAGVVV